MTNCKNNFDNRIDWIDYAKGLGIIMFVLGHTRVPYIPKYFCYAFHVPLFFFLSGYCFSIKRYSCFKEFLKRKAKTILLPYVLFSLMWIAVDTLLELLFGDITMDFFANELFGAAIQIRNHTIWFLTCLFLTELIMYFAAKNLKSVGQFILVAVAFAIIGWIYYSFVGKALLWNADIVLTAMPFFIAGYCLCQYGKTAEKLFCARHIAIWLLITIGINYVNVKIFNNNISVGMCQSLYGNFALYFIAAFAGIIMIVSVAKQINNSKLLKYLGMNSIVFFAVHQFITNIVIKILEQRKLDNVVNLRVTAVSLVTFFAALLFAAVVNEIIQRTPLCLFIGKKYINKKQTA